MAQKGQKTGKYYGGGMPKGHKTLKTVAKEAAREIARELITAELEPLVRTHIANAQGTKYLVVRNVKTGKFERVSKERMELLLETGDKELEAIEVYDKDPSVEAFKTLMDRALDQPAKPTENLNANVRHEIIWKGDL